MNIFIKNIKIYLKNNILILLIKEKVGIIIKLINKAQNLIILLTFNLLNNKLKILILC